MRSYTVVDDASQITNPDAHFARALTAQRAFDWLDDKLTTTL